MQFRDFIKEDSVLEYHDKLNEKLWDHGCLKPDVLEHLQKIAEAFITYLDIPAQAVKDVVLCGGNAAYAYTRYSDIDIHLIVNEDEVTHCKRYLSEYFFAKKQLWSMQHAITVKGYPVELYAQPITEKFINSQGVYSLRSLTWIQEPTKNEINVNDVNVTTKVAEFQTQIDQMIENKAADQDQIKELKAKLVRMRKEALQKAGELSVGNLVYKSLRNNGYFAKLDSLQKSIFDSKMSLK